MWTKICGIRDVSTAKAVAALKPSAIGLNFFAGSPRHVAVDQAVEIVRALPADVEAVGVFVNHSAAEIDAICARCGLRTAQIHGDEKPELLAEVSLRSPGLQLVRAFRMGVEGLSPLGEYLEACAKLGVKLRACLVDAHIAGQYGGTGQTVPWGILRKEYRRDIWPPLILAGGLTPENLADAIRAAEPWGVDVAGGVESSPGVKDLARVERFLAAAIEKSRITPPKH
jgi:phosphoribosylanthranilate isomerase